VSVKTGTEAHPAFYLVGRYGSVSGDKVAGGVKLTTHLNLVPRLRMVELYLQSPYVFVA
jgi:hypothetical protein